MTKFDPDSQRARFHELRAQREKIVAKSEPLRAKRDKFASEARDKELEMNQDIKEAEAGLAEIDQEMAFISKGLGGRTGLPDGTMPDDDSANAADAAQGEPDADKPESQVRHKVSRRHRS